MRILAGDVGGTKTLLCIAECDADTMRIIRQQRFENAAYENFNDVLRTFLQPEHSADFAGVCVAVAGPVRDTPTGQHVKVTNLPWELNGHALAREFSFRRMRLINDFAAIGYGIEGLRDEDLVALQAGEPVAHGPRAVIGAGTGLGQAILVWQLDHYDVIATEGSKADFGPTNELQLELARYLMQRHKRASYELILSGSGLVRLYRFLRERGALPEAPAVVEAILQGDPAAAITHAALEQNDPLANAALDLFVSIYGAQAGNLALTAGTTGGVYIAGGIAPKIVSRLTNGTFISAFTNKGKMSAYVGAMSVQVVTNPTVGLLGAVSVASRV
jgi:glucokinase